MVEATERQPHRVRIEGPNQSVEIHPDAVESQLLTDLYATWFEYTPFKNKDIANFADAAGWTIRALHGNKRESGDLPSSSHSLEVALILAKAGLDGETIVAGLLHDGPEDTKNLAYGDHKKITHEMIETRFGPGVAEMVDNLTKVKGSANQDLTPQNHLKMFEALLEDPRTIFIKLADRLHNMRTINGLIDKTKQRKKAEETLKLYAPLAMHLGMKEWAEELMDLSFQTLYKRDYPKIRELYQRTLSEDTMRKVLSAVQGLTIVPEDIFKRTSPRLEVHIEYPSLGYLYKENDGSFPDISKEHMTPLITLVVKKRRIKHLPAGFRKKYGMSESEDSNPLLRYSEQDEWLGDVSKYLTKIGKASSYQGNPWERLLEITAEKTPYVHGTFLGNDLPFRLRFVTKRAYEEEQSSLMDIYNGNQKAKYAKEKLKKLQKNIQRARNILRKGTGERVSQIVKQITQNLDTDLIYIITPLGKTEVVQKGTVRDVIWQLHEGIAESATSYTITRGKDKPITDSDFNLPVEEHDRIEIHFKEKKNVAQVSWLDEAQTRYARKKISERLRRKIKEEEKLPVVDRVVTIQTIERGERELRRQFFRYAYRMNEPLDELRVGVDKAKRKWEHHHTRKNPLGDDPSILTPQDFLIHLGLEEISMHGSGRVIIKNTVTELFNIQRSLVPVEIDLTDDPGSFALVSDHVSRELGINILGIMGIARQSAVNAQHVVFYLTKKDARKLTVSELERIRALSCVSSVIKGLSMDEESRGKK